MRNRARGSRPARRGGSLAPRGRAGRRGPPAGPSGSLRGGGARLVDVLARWLPEALGRPVPRARVRALVVGRGGARRRRRCCEAAGRARCARASGSTPSSGRSFSRPRAERTDRPFRLTRPRRSLPRRRAARRRQAPGPPHPRHRGPLAPQPRRARRAVPARDGGAAVRRACTRGWTGTPRASSSSRPTGGRTRASRAPSRAARVEKTYLALTARPPGASRDGSASRCRSRPRAGPRGRRGRGRSRPRPRSSCARSLADALLVEARPLTGRKHQVRVHLAHAGMPILGDPVYGDAGGRAPRLMLHARRLALPHPLTGAPARDREPAARGLRRAPAEQRRRRARRQRPTGRGRRSATGRGGSAARGPRGARRGSRAAATPAPRGSRGAAV